MATQRLKVQDLFAASPSPIEPQTQPASYARPFGDDPTIASRGPRTEAERLRQEVVDLRLLGKGVGWAIGIEGVTALCLYALWFVGHLRL